MVIRVILCIILALLIVILVSRYGVELSYLEKQFRIRIRVGPFRFELPKMKKKEEKAGEGSSEQPKEEKPPKEKPKIQWEDIPTLADLAITALGRIFRSIDLDELMLHLSLGFRDPYDTAVRLNFVNAALEILLDGGFLKPRKQDVVIWPDFVEEKCEVEGRLSLSMRLYKIVAAGLALLWGYLRWKNQKKKKSACSAERT